MTATADRLTQLMQLADRLPPEQRAAFHAWAGQETVRRNALRACAHPAELAQLIDPAYVITPAIRMMSEHIERAVTTRGGRLLITCPPQEGKTTLVAVWTVVRQLQRRPDSRILIASYSEDLARRSAREARNLILAYGTDARDPLTGVPLPDRLGLSLAGDRWAQGNWQIRGHQGGVVAVGMGGTITGRACDLLIIDDPLKGMAAADSPTERAKVITGYQADLSTRLAPGAPIIIIQTRWHEQDLAGHLLAQDADRPPAEREWVHINIPAVATSGVPDALGRAEGDPLESARGRTPEDWDRTRRAVGERVWAALYLGVPTPVGGGLFSTAWFDAYRLPAAPPLHRRLVTVDPAETGKGDEAGIMAAGMTRDGTVMLTDDWSGHLSSAEWPRRACLLALTTGADEIVFEAYSAPTTYAGLLRRAYADLVVEAAAAGGVVDGVAVPPDRPFHITPWKATGNALVRSVGLRNATSTGRCRVVAYKLATYEAHAVRWQEGQHCPDRVAAATIAYDVLAGGDGVQMSAPAGWGDLPSGLLR
ncbi:terminase family protein [Nocardia sp. CDC159]|uniref:Terminase family protein n=1 Tax=Nocardia pulmonis TaxID=2951408 RepID=A0A9X2IZB8_9NOCA|nr:MULTISPECIES: terminase family protein [Nocardia]MCM6777907.1 terminase family protein [Nocardia pulmonis]MCM6790922.1 terminase family protein [Nocardia sp. CDC159]